MRRCPSEISGPISVASSSGAPTRIAAVAAENRSTYSSYTPRWTSIREREQQSCPALSKTDQSALGIAASRSASSNTTHADLPPSSSETRVMFAAAACITRVPTSVEPVKEIFATRGSSTSAFATLAPGPGRTLRVPSGSPASVRRSASASAVNGVWLAGLTTAVFPQARAGAIFQLAITAGKFHGVISAQTPTGSRSVRSIPGGTIGIVSPMILFAAPPQYSKTFATMSISARAEPIGLPPLRASRVASASCRSRTSRLAAVRMRPRSRALIRRHGPSSKARAAIATALAASSGPACATSQAGAAVDGSTTSAVAPSAAAMRSPPSASSSVAMGGA